MIVQLIKFYIKTLKCTDLNHTNCAILITRSRHLTLRSSSSNRLSPNSRDLAENLSAKSLLIRGIEAENCATLNLRVAKLLYDIESFLGGIDSVRWWFDLTGSDQLHELVQLL